MKRTLTLFLCFVILLSSLTGCLVRVESGDGKGETEATQTTDKNHNEDTTAPVEEDVTTKPADTTDDTTADTEHKHEYDEKVVAATCTQGGYTKYTCTCGHSFTEAETPAKGHSYTSKVTPATQSAGGYTTHTCSTCGHSYKDSYTDKLSGGNDSGNNNEGTNASGSFFDKSVFIGDSVSEMLEIYESNTNVFGKATFLCETGLALYNYVKDNSYGKVTYNGQKMKIEDAVAATGATNVFILLGTNDLVWVNIDKIVKDYGTLINNIKAKVPGVQIYIQSGTPVYPKDHGNGLTNPNVDAYNVKLQALAASTGCKYIDIATPFKDANGAMDAQYCSDKYVHLTYAACKIWVDTLKAYLGIK